MKTLSVLLILFLIGIIIYSVLRKKKLPTTTLAPVTTYSPVTTEPVNKVFYQLSRCDTSELLETGPVDLGTFNSGEQVEGATNVFYVVTISSSESFGHQNIMVTKTYKMGC